MPCASEHESGATRDKICSYKALVGYHFHRFPDSSISYEYVLTGGYTNAIHSLVRICDVLRTRLFLTIQNPRAKPNLSVTSTRQNHISWRSHQAPWLQKVNFKFLF